MMVLGTRLLYQDCRNQGNPLESYKLDRRLCIYNQNKSHTNQRQAYGILLIRP